jgi:hypothetical protein
MSLLAGIATGIGALGGALFGKKSTDSANKTNLKINQMNNDFNAREAQKARDFQLDMWNKENEYNKASSQRKRLEEAGYNPYMSDAQAGTAAGMSGTSAATAVGATPQVPYTPDFQSVGVNLASALKMMSEKKQTDIENLNMSDLLRSQIWQRGHNPTREHYDKYTSIHPNHEPQIFHYLEKSLHLYRL